MLMHMDLSRFDTMDAGELRSYLAFLLWHYRVVDSFWFLYTVDERSQSEAEKLNERVWARVSGLAARDLLSRFKITPTVSRDLPNCFACIRGRCYSSIR